MGTHAHRPRPPAGFAGHPHDDAFHAPGPGVRPGVESRLMAARERMRRRGF